MVWRAVARILVKTIKPFVYPNYPFLVNNFKVVNFKYQLGTFIGSVLFAFSDTILALNKFVLEFDYAQVSRIPKHVKSLNVNFQSVIMSSYYAAQLLISLGVLDPRHPVD